MGFQYQQDQQQPQRDAAWARRQVAELVAVSTARATQVLNMAYWIDDIGDWGGWIEEAQWL